MRSFDTELYFYDRPQSHTASELGDLWSTRIAKRRPIRPITRYTCLIPNINGSIYIDRPPEVVFDFVADERNEPTYNPKMTSVSLLTGEPIGVGSRFAATLMLRAQPMGPITVIGGPSYNCALIDAEIFCRGVVKDRW